MKTLYLAATLAALTTPAWAGDLTTQGLDDPEVTKPAAVGDWTGPYVGLSYGRTKSSDSRTEYTEQCFKFNDLLGERFSDTPVDCATYVPPAGYSLERVQVPGDTVTTETSQDHVGAFLGYRHDFGRIVGGIEAGVLGDMKSLEAQGGVDLGNVLVYGLAGFGDADGTSGTIYGAGADLKLGNRLLLGVKHTAGDFDGSTSLRVGIRF